MSMVALTIDALLPALDIIGESIGVTQASDNQLLVTMIFLGLGVGPMIFGPLSDSYGRKPVVYFGFGIFVIASLICVYAPNLEYMIAGRILQGIGLSAPRTIAIAIVRDKYSGDQMARIMSFVSVVFLLVPIVAPAIGKWILDAANWESIFYIQVLTGVLVMIWFWKRQPETLKEKNRIPVRWKVFTNGFKQVLNQRITMGYTFVSGFIFGSFMVYLSTSQQVFEEQYGLKEEFPYLFAGLAVVLAISIFSNANLVLKYGMRRMVNLATISYFISSLAYVVFYYNEPNPAIYVLLSFFAVQFFAIGYLFGNLRALAMEPVGHIAGIAAAITGLISTLMAVPISTYIGKFVMGSVYPLFVGFLASSLISLSIIGYLQIRHRRDVHTVPATE